MEVVEIRRRDLRGAQHAIDALALDDKPHTRIASLLPGRIEDTDIGDVVRNHVVQGEELAVGAPSGLHGHVESLRRPPVSPISLGPIRDVQVHEVTLQ